MKQIEIKKTGDMLYYETLENGLQIFMFPKNDVNTTLVSFNVKYGAIHNEFIPIDEKQMRKFPNGIAHFLEHKMFEQESGIDPMLFYAINGADVNAYTSLYNTSYHFSCTSRLKENLLYLLDFVQQPYFTDENVLKEKGIIEEEIKMYDDDPYSVLDEKIRFNAFLNHPLKYPIAGTIDDINAITKDDLYKCYNTFYHPSNMFLVITGNFDVQDTIDIIRENQSKKEFAILEKIALKRVDEDNTVVNSYEEKQMNIEVTKVSYGLKIPLKGIKMELKKLNFYLRIMFNSLFDATSLFHEEMKNKGYLLSSVMIDNYFTDDHIFVTINADTEYEKELLQAIKEVLSNVDINEDDFNRKINVVMSNEIYKYDNVEMINRSIVDDLILYGQYYANIDIILSSMNLDELKRLTTKLRFDITSTLIIKPISE